MTMEEKNRPAAAHSIILTGREKLSVSGVEDVESFDDTEIVMNTVQGDLCVRGSGLHVDKLDLALGELTVTGLVTALDYTEVAPSGSLWSRLLR